MTSTFLTAGDLISMQNVLNRSLPGTAVIHRNTQTSDGQGGKTDAWSAVGTTVCRVSSYTPGNFGDEELHGNDVRAIRDRLITLPANTDITENDRIITSSVTYEVVAMDGPRTYELARRVRAARV